MKLYKNVFRLCPQTVFNICHSIIIKSIDFKIKKDITIIMNIKKLKLI